MKKVIIAVLSVLMFAPIAFADNWGLGVKLGGGQNDPKVLKDANGPGTDLDKNGAYFGLEALYEWNLDETNKVGAKIGWDVYGDNELKATGVKVTEETYSFPLTAYYKKDNGVQAFSWFGGAGVTMIRTNVKQEVIGTDKTHKNKIFPHIVVGGEYRFTELFALGLEARYNFGAKVKKDGVELSNRSGFGAALTGRFYF